MANVTPMSPTSSTKISPVRVLVACEFSGIVRDAFQRHGHDAISCDLDPSERPGLHIHGDVSAVLRESWDLVIAHPPCTYLANSGVRWLHVRPERWRGLWEGAGFFLACLHANAPRIAVENPVMHKYGRELIGRRPDFTIQPWQFGHGETKRICLWTTNLPSLTPTNIVTGREPRVHWGCGTKGTARQKERSRFFEGIAEAMAQQWGSLE